MNTIESMRTDEVIQTDGRSTCRKVTVVMDGREWPAFAKTPNGVDVEPYVTNQLLREPEVTQAGTEAGRLFRAPDPYGMVRGEDDTFTAVYEWLEGESLAKEEGRVETVRLLAQIAAALARYQSPSASGASTRRPSWSLREAYEDHMARFRAELEPLIEAGVIGRGIVERGLAFIAAQYPKLKSGFSHGDLTAKHLFPDRTSRAQVVITDGEHARDTWPAHYDAANLLARYAVTYPSTLAVAAAFDQYRASVGGDPEELLVPLTASLMVRSLATVKGMALPLTPELAELRDRAVRVAAALPNIHTMAELRQLLIDQTILS